MSSLLIRDIERLDRGGCLLTCCSCFDLELSLLVIVAAFPMKKFASCNYQKETRRIALVGLADNLAEKHQALL